MKHLYTCIDFNVKFRTLSGTKAGRKPEVLRVVELSKVPMAVTVQDIRDLCETAVKTEDVLNVEGKQIGHSLKMTVCSSPHLIARFSLNWYK